LQSISVLQPLPLSQPLAIQLRAIAASQIFDRVMLAA